MKITHILFATALAGCAVAAAAQEITLFEGENFSGQRFAANGSMPNLDPSGFNDRASSAIIRGGTWQLCSEAYYRGNCVTLQPGNYPTLGAMGLANRLSSLREIGWNTGGGGGVPGGGGGGYGARAQLFEGEGFGGQSVMMEQTLPNFDQSGFNDRARSLIVFSGTWQLCSDAFFQGDCRNYGPGRYDSLGGTNGQTRSARPCRRGRALVRSGSKRRWRRTHSRRQLGGRRPDARRDVRGSEFFRTFVRVDTRRTAQFRQRGLQRQGVVNSRRARVLGVLYGCQLRRRLPDVRTGRLPQPAVGDE
jgi:hypothetical protein